MDGRPARRDDHLRRYGAVQPGGQRPAVRIQADTKALASYGIGLDTLRSAISAGNANSAKGSFDGPLRSYTINANDQLLTVDDYKNLIVSWRNGAPVRMIEVARVVEGAENNRLGAWAGLSAAPAGTTRSRCSPASGWRSRAPGSRSPPPTGSGWPSASWSGRRRTTCSPAPS